MDRIYLDYTADTPVDERGLSVYTETVEKFFANPNSLHCSGKDAKKLIDDSLAGTSELLKVSPSELIFTSSASEANNLAVKGIAHTSRRRGKHIVSTFLEHSSVSGALTFLQEQGWEIDIVNIKPDGKIDLEHLKALLRQDTVLCAVCAVDSELGAVQPISGIAEILKDYPNCKLHIDATQAIGKIKLDLSVAHTASLAPHKFYGLKGCGILYRSSDTILEPLIHGGASTTIYRSGTPDTAGIVACHKALELADIEFEERLSKVTSLNQKLRKQLSEIDRVRINSPEDAVPHILNISVNGIKGADMQRMLDEQGVCVSVKSACSVPNTPSRAVMAITHDRKNAMSSWRISLSHLTTEQELDRFIEILGGIISKV